MRRRPLAARRPVIFADPSTTTTTTPPTTMAPSAEASATWHGEPVTLAAGELLPCGTPSVVGDLSAFATTDPALACMSQDQAIPVTAMSSAPDELFVLASTASGDCTDAELAVILPDSLGAGQGPYP